MTIELSHIFMAFIGIIMSVIGWFLKRDIARFEKMMDKHNDQLGKHTESLAKISEQIAQVLEIGKWNAQLQRFFGEGGGHARLWRNIEELQFNEAQIRERLHWFMNRMSIIKGSMEMANLKCGNADGWTMPEWKSLKEKETK